ncbi:hypothetical protein BXZ70DRAFT_1013083 [Cristinia sonorae]|uniref:DUF6533 domain-containing protein n=1 Tax=Cristinia sonorae TaxID=1940300 RepID=A0A8K0XJP8_9AGAR|nr:hypothetical protein BXZ70DRAFT_1013083 [Cristinia sonorae]
MVEALATQAGHLMAAKMFSLASCVMLFYDMVLTFGDEVEKIWKQRFSGATVLWCINRYVSPLGYIVIIVSFHDPWPKSVCSRYVLYPEILKIFTACAIGIIFILRLYSIYSRNVYILVSFTVMLVAELAVKIWAFTDGTMLSLPPELVGCILVGKSSASERMVYTWVAELVFDTSVFLATLYRTLYLYRTAEAGAAMSLIKIIMRDGIMYFAAIFVSNLVTVLMFVAAPPDLKVVNASFSTLITSLMVSRLMLNLRREALRRRPIFDYRVTDPAGAIGTEARFAVMSSNWAMSSESGFATGITSASSNALTGGMPIRTFEDSLIGNLGAEVTIWGDEDDEDEEDVKGLEEGAERLEMEVVRKGIEVQVTEEVQVIVDEQDASRTVLSPRSRRYFSPRAR